MLIKAAIVIIGNEILSGRTLDINTQYIAKKLSEIGIKLVETRIIADDHDSIISSILDLKHKYDYIFTTGGIGPTHDDITAKAVADAFNIPLERNEEAYNIIKAFYDSKGEALNSGRIKMSFLPKGSTLINNPISWAPGFIIKNVFVMAGVPHIMRAMLDHVIPKLQHNLPIMDRSIDIMVGESLVAEDFANLQNKYPEIEMGSYPFEKNGKHGTTLALRSIDLIKLEQSYLELMSLVKQYK
jgi:molybdenum cofactor synthesis domain-containing protein